jgi:hypothetical protein
VCRIFITSPSASIVRCAALAALGVHSCLLGSTPVRSNTSRTVEALLRAGRAEGDFAGWLAAALATVAGLLWSNDALFEGRPGSWEARLVDQLVKGTVGYGDEYVPGPRTKLTDAKLLATAEAMVSRGMVLGRLL